MNKIDFKLLKRQKNILIRMIQDWGESDDPTQKQEALEVEGVIDLIDDIQDQVVEKGKSIESIVFEMDDFNHEEEYKKELTLMGFCTENMRSIKEVQSRFRCGEHEAMQLLKMTFRDAHFNDEISQYIGFFANIMGFSEKSLNDNLFMISGHWKENGQIFEDLLVCGVDQVPEHVNVEDVFHYRLSEEVIQDSIDKKEDKSKDLDFVITSYKNCEIY